MECDIPDNAVEVKEQKFIMFINETVLILANANFVYSLLQIKKVCMGWCTLINIKAMCSDVSLFQKVLHCV